MLWIVIERYISVDRLLTPMSIPFGRQGSVLSHLSELAVVVSLGEDKQHHSTFQQRLVVGDLELLSNQLAAAFAVANTVSA